MPCLGAGEEEVEYPLHVAMLLGGVMQAVDPEGSCGVDVKYLRAVDAGFDFCCGDSEELLEGFAKVLRPLLIACSRRDVYYF